MNPYDQWSVAAKFRTSGGDRPGGSLSIWYTEKGPAGGSGSGMDSIYNSKPWDGLVLVVDSHAGTGTLRGYLNDGTKDYSVHHNPSSLSFAHCDFDYRNKGYLSEIRLTQGGKSLKVELNDQLCFETQKARLPRGYYFGLTAATSEAPDSFELFNFVVSAPKGAKKYDQAPSPPKIIEAPKKPEHAQQPMKGAGAFKEREPKQEKSQGRAPPPANEFQDWAQEYHQESGEADHEAKYYKSQEEQFSDLHDRLQALVCCL